MSLLFLEIMSNSAGVLSVETLNNHQRRVVSCSIRCLNHASTVETQAEKTSLLFERRKQYGTSWTRSTRHSSRISRGPNVRAHAVRETDTWSGRARWCTQAKPSFNEDADDWHVSHHDRVAGHSATPQSTGDFPALTLLTFAPPAFALAACCSCRAH